jgi:hypothetical protein
VAADPDFADDAPQDVLSFVVGLFVLDLAARTL